MAYGYQKSCTIRKSKKTGGNGTTMKSILLPVRLMLLPAKAIFRGILNVKTLFIITSGQYRIYRLSDHYFLFWFI
ncbi:hypothetical protein DLD82_02625 [Methanospirillum stamsii]|uniref:Uncharacterized protein n=1 Tax=Methanospirillum stamsii TaxID=1277351 RepID=A0A2V2NB50_9EURY|nr:hypothetical protein DLD82_02625 [Methanospirillum stamsii]